MKFFLLITPLTIMMVHTHGTPIIPNSSTNTSTHRMKKANSAQKKLLRKVKLRTQALKDLTKMQQGEQQIINKKIVNLLAENQTLKNIVTRNQNSTQLLLHNFKQCVQENQILNQQLNVHLSQNLIQQQNIQQSRQKNTVLYNKLISAMEIIDSYQKELEKCQQANRALAGVIIDQMNFLTMCDNKLVDFNNVLVSLNNSLSYPLVTPTKPIFPLQITQPDTKPIKTSNSKAQDLLNWIHNLHAINTNNTEHKGKGKQKRKKQSLFNSGRLKSPQIS